MALVNGDQMPYFFPDTKAFAKAAPRGALRARSIPSRSVRMAKFEERAEPDCSPAAIALARQDALQPPAGFAAAGPAWPREGGCSRSMPAAGRPCRPEQETEAGRRRAPFSQERNR